jgi:hypothetical protein
MSVLAALSSCLLLAGAGDEVPLSWRGAETTTGRLPAELPAAARAAIDEWKGWCAERGYRFDLDEAARVLFVSRKDNSRRETQLELVQACAARFDRELPVPKRLPDPRPKPEAPPAPKPKTGPLPEDPEEEGAHPWKLAPPSPERTTRTPTTFSWGAKTGAPSDTETVVLVLVRHQKDFERLLAEIGKLNPLLADWAKSARALQGVVLGDPLVAAYLELPDGVEEWDPDHELINRLARLLLLRRFAELPNWFVQGYAWHMEFALRNAVYCFPWRDEFVWATEHTGWDKILAEWFEKDELNTDFLGWKRGAHKAQEAKTSWGVVEFMLEYEGARTPDLLEALRAYAE